MDYAKGRQALRYRSWVNQNKANTYVFEYPVEV